METSSPRKLRVDPGLALAIVGTVLAISLPVGQSIAANAQSEREERQAMVKIATGILSQRPQSVENGGSKQFPADQQEIRRWAVGVINGNQNQKLPADPNSALITGKAWIYSSGDYATYDFQLDEKDALSPSSEGKTENPTPSR